MSDKTEQNMSDESEISTLKQKMALLEQALATHMKALGRVSQERDDAVRRLEAGAAGKPVTFTVSVPEGNLQQILAAVAAFHTASARDPMEPARSDLLREIDELLEDAGVWAGGRLDSVKALIDGADLAEKIATELARAGYTEGGVLDSVRRLLDDAQRLREIDAELTRTADVFTLGGRLDSIKKLIEARKGVDNLTEQRGRLIEKEDLLMRELEKANAFVGDELTSVKKLIGLKNRLIEKEALDADLEGQLRDANVWVDDALTSIKVLIESRNKLGGVIDRLEAQNTQQTEVVRKAAADRKAAEQKVAVLEEELAARTKLLASHFEMGVVRVLARPGPFTPEEQEERDLLLKMREAVLSAQDFSTNKT